MDSSDAHHHRVINFAFGKTNPRASLQRGFLSGGPKRDRTADLHNAIVALSQLSYGPEARTRIAVWGGGPKSGQKLSSGPF
jgi:hypothetical protein